MKLFRKIVDSITNEIRYVKYFIEYIVDFSAKKSENDFIVRTNVDSHLDKCKLILICFAQFEINISFLRKKNWNSWIGNDIPKITSLHLCTQPSKFCISCFHYKCSASHKRHFIRDPDTNGRERYERLSSTIGDNLQDGIHTEYWISLSNNWMESIASRQCGFGEFRVQIC